MWWAVAGKIYNPSPRQIMPIPDSFAAYLLRA
ncbi:MAG: hypothetical protein ACI9EF_003138, partial [Pseudohongiellaceae bacterium]